MKVTNRARDGVKILDLDGNIKTPEDLDDFSKAIDAEIKENNGKILLNFKGISFINSSGLGRLILAVKKVGEINGTLGVFYLAEDLDELFTFTRLKEKINVYKDEEEAIKEFQDS